MDSTMVELSYEVYDLMCGHCPQEKTCHIFDRLGAVLEYNNKIRVCIGERFEELRRLRENKPEKVVFV